MSWECPKCNRQFKNPNQWHSCVQVSLDDHFYNKSPQIKETYDQLMSFTESLGSIRISSMQSGILVASKSTFLALKPKRNWIDVEFYLDHEQLEFPIYKTLQVSKNRIVHFVRLEQTKDIDNQLLRWIENAYKLVSD